MKGGSIKIRGGQAETEAQKWSLASQKQGTKSRGQSDDIINVMSPTFLLWKVKLEARNSGPEVSTWNPLQ
jgi:hypothetical protein